jgi:hypothetical protein
LIPSPLSRQFPSRKSYRPIGITAAGHLDFFLSLSSFLIPGILAYWYNLNHFYNRGGYAWDAGWMAQIIGHPSLTLPIAPILDLNKLGSFYGYHFMPLLTAISWIGALLPLSPPHLLTIILGAVYGTIGAAVYASLRFAADPGWRPIALATAIISVFSGPALAVIAFPHYEPVIPALILAFFALRALGHEKAALLAFAACLLIREDGGLHFTLALGFVVFFRSCAMRSLRVSGQEVVLIASSLTYVAMAMIIQRVWFDGGHLFRTEFLGDPAFASLSWSTLSDRAGFFLRYRQYIYFPMLVTIAAALLTRRWMLLAGFAMGLPWLIFCLTA